jgi:sugar diacid utilization regulator
MLPTVETLASQLGSGRLVPLPGAGSGRSVGSVSLAEDLAAVDVAPPASLVLLTRSASAEATSYRFDVALRRGSERGIAGIALARSVSGSLPRSARAAGKRGHVGLLTYADEVDLADLAAALVAILTGDAAAALERAATGLKALEAARVGGAGVAETLEAVRLALPGAAFGEATDGMLTEPVEIDGVPEGWLVASEGGPVDRLLLRAGAADLAASIGRVRREQDAPIRSRSELLTELLATEPGRDVGLLRRARTLGLAVDGWHTVILIAVDRGPADDPVELDERRRVIERVALSVARTVAGSWHVSRSEGFVVLLRTSGAEPAGPGAVVAAATAVLAALEERAPGSGPRAGIGRSHLGPVGLRASTAEARAALAGATPGDPAVFDATGLRAMLAEWYATDSARRAVSSLLEPLDRMGPGRANEAVRTLQVFLEEQGSVTRTARRLHLHRNAVANRIRRIFDELGAERDDPDTLLALQLACRARSLA